jgi:hypothetical protein
VKITGNINIPLEAERALRAGKKIEAIRLIRQSMNIGLAESKAVLEAFESNPPRSAAPMGGDSHDRAPARSAQPLPRATAPGYVRRAGLSPGEVPRTHNGVQAALFIVAILIAIGVYIKLG